jgi:imidazolonepropionase-like amidohydrolase
VTQATAQPATRITITADRCWDGIGDAPSGPVAVIVEGSQITAVGAPGSLPSTDQRIRLGDRTPMPGFIDCHVRFVNEQQNQGSIVYQALGALRRRAGPATPGALQPTAAKPRRPCHGRRH